MTDTIFQNSMKMFKKRGKETRVVIPESVSWNPMHGPSPYDGPEYDLTWSTPIVEEKFTKDQLVRFNSQGF